MAEYDVQNGRHCEADIISRARCARCCALDIVAQIDIGRVGDTLQLILVSRVMISCAILLVGVA